MAQRRAGSTRRAAKIIKTIKQGHFRPTARRTAYLMDIHHPIAPKRPARTKRVFKEFMK
jgi:hypothetical protein